MQEIIAALETITAANGFPIFPSAIVEGETNTPRALSVNPVEGGAEIRIAANGRIRAALFENIVAVLSDRYKLTSGDESIIAISEEPSNGPTVIDQDSNDRT